MSTIQELEATSEKALAAKELLIKHVQVSNERSKAAVERACSVIIRDRLIYPHKMHVVQRNGAISLVYEENDGGMSRVTVHNHALGQMADRAGIPRTYVSRLLGSDGNRDSWKAELLEHNFNELFHKGTFIDRGGEPKQFLHRIVDNELRGFMSNQFHIYLATGPLLKGFLESCSEHGAAPVEAHNTDVRMSIKCVLPHVFEPVKNEFVAFGVTFSTSDFGAGSLKIQATAMRVRSRTISLVEDSYSRNHLGPVLKEADLVMSTETAKKQLAAQKSAINDIVKAQLGYKSINKLLVAIRAAHDNHIRWDRLKGKLSKVLQDNEISIIEQLLKTGGDAIVDLPTPALDDDGDPIATGWWASNMVGWMANNEKDIDRKQELQSLAGDLLGPKAA